ncbi:hypothetical protein M0804_008972 [Polistes exclamans]|nr:hypothetical protein M0804_008972 [Polistes exclamans]
MCENSKLAESTGSHLDETSPNPCLVIYWRSFEQRMVFITKLHVGLADGGGDGGGGGGDGGGGHRRINFLL